MAGASVIAVLLSLLIIPPQVSAHGGVTIADGQRRGVTILVQGSAATTPAGASASDIATTLVGPGAGPGASVVYYVRPSGAKAFRVQTERDEGGVFHAEIATSGRGEWHDWAVSALVTLSNGKRFRVTNNQSNPPGPQVRKSPGATPSSEGDAGTTPPDSDVGADTAAESSAAAVDDISGETDGAPAWAVPSMLALIALGGAVTLVRARRRR